MSEELCPDCKIDLIYNKGYRTCPNCGLCIEQAIGIRKGQISETPTLQANRKKYPNPRPYIREYKIPLAEFFKYLTKHPIFSDNEWRQLQSIAYLMEKEPGAVYTESRIQRYWIWVLINYCLKIKHRPYISSEMFHLAYWVRFFRFEAKYKEIRNLLGDFRLEQFHVLLAQEMNMGENGERKS